MLILTYFNPIIGPDILYSVPKNITDIVSEDDINQIKRLMDAATPGFFTHAFSAELNTANYFFMIPSAWARGKQEMVMITKIIEEESPNFNSYEHEFKEFVKIIKEKRKEIYKALYINNPPLNYEEEIKGEFEYLTKEFEILAKFFAIGQAQTHGILVPFQDLRKKQSLHLPIKIVRDLESFIETRKNYFVVFQKRKENFKVDIIPYDQERVVKIAVIFNGQLSPDTLKEISIVFQELQLPFVYTSGICQQGGKCIYEVYLNPLNFDNFDETKERLRQIRDVDEIKLIEIDLLHEN
ncbi:hypothetical protein NEF87_004254 [Candidatus Lokiarchaeum ossiferum]|uniref:Uncharacterized protein n=1 Tax=Candidatus Lokiarchaeum ossiferum TaxID=2951803 RepID=A0ABY6HZU2_9ARCH|nr:hypothetical protein NEF87_004254 [Candidatus Lokiarchaeum sp. B-35]